MTRALVALIVLALALWAAGTASAHFIIVDPQGNGNGTAHHVGQFPPGHNSCSGLSTAASHEGSAAVTFLGPPAAACPP